MNEIASIIGTFGLILEFFPASPILLPEQKWKKKRLENQIAAVTRGKVKQGGKITAITFA